MFKLYVFDPKLVQIEGYSYEGSFDTEQECNQEAFEIGYNFFRIEKQTEFGSMLVYESSTEEQ